MKTRVSQYQPLSYRTLRKQERQSLIARRFVVLFFLAMILEGGLRKWVIPAYGMPLQILRDLIPFLGVLVLLLNSRLKRPPHYFDKGVAFFFIYFVFAVIAAPFSLDSGWFTILLGLRTHFAYIPLVFLVTYGFRDLEEIHKFLSLLVFSSIPILLLALVQNNLPAGHLLNIYASGEAAEAHFGLDSLVRASGTFPYITGMQLYATFITVITFYLWITSEKKIKTLFSFILVLAFFTTLATGSRSSVLWAVIQVALISLVASRYVTRRLGVISLLILCLMGYFLLEIFSGQYLAFSQRLSGSSDIGWRLHADYIQWLAVGFDSFFGNGLGIAHQSVGGKSGLGGFVYESELSRVAYEIGFLGVLFFVAFKLYLIYISFNLALKVKSTQQKFFFAFVGSFFISYFTGSVYSPFSNAAFWLFTGLMISAFRYCWSVK